jgi:sugar O-acyltransferase (sialic acid O-acetyltransferase NeuD family)
MAKVIVFGTGLIGTLAQYYLTHDSPHEVVAFSADAERMQSDEHRGLPLVAFEEMPSHYPPDEFSMFVAVGWSKLNKVREEKFHAAKAAGYQLISYVASSAITWPDSTIGENCFIQEMNVIQPFATIGDDVTMWTGSLVGHESVVGDHCFIAAQVVVSGNVTIGRNCFIGVHATLRDAITIGEESVIGAGALIMKDVKPRSVYVGQSAQRLAMTSDRLPRI